MMPYHTLLRVKNKKTHAAYSMFAGRVVYSTTEVGFGDEGKRQARVLRAVQRSKATDMC